MVVFLSRMNTSFAERLFAEADSRLPLPHFRALTVSARATFRASSPSICRQLEKPYPGRILAYAERVVSDGAGTQPALTKPASRRHSC